MCNTSLCIKTSSFPFGSSKIIPKGLLSLMFATFVLPNFPSSPGNLYCHPHCQAITSTCIAFFGTLINWFQTISPGAKSAATPKVVANVSIVSNFLSSGLYSALRPSLYENLNTQ